MEAIGRRRFLALLTGGVFCVAPALAAQSTARIGVLMSVSETDPEAPLRVAKFFEGLAEQGVAASDVEVTWRWVESTPGWMEARARELVELEPDILVGSATPQTAALLALTSEIPLVFGLSADPVGSGFADSLAHPGHNATGFINFEASLAGKWVDLIGQAVPNLTDLTIMFNPATAVHGGTYFYEPFEAAAVAAGLKIWQAPVASAEDIDSAIAKIADQDRGALVVAPDAYVAVKTADRLSKLPPGIGYRPSMPIVTTWRTAA